MVVLHFLWLTLCFQLVLSTQLSSYFKLKGQESSLKIVTYDQYQVRDRWECAQKCQRNSLCLSFNLILSGKNWTCQENFERMDVSGVWLTPLPGALYYERMTNPVSPYMDVTSAGYDPIANNLFVACSNKLFHFTDIDGMPQVGPTTSFSLPVSTTAMRYLPESPTDEAWFHTYLDNNTIYLMKSSRGSVKTTVAFSAVGTVEGVHGKALNVTDIFFYEGLNYMISNQELFLLGSDLRVQRVGLLRGTDTWNLFQKSPTGLTAATEVDNERIFFFRGRSFFHFHVPSNRVTSAGMILKKTP